MNSCNNSRYNYYKLQKGCIDSTMALLSNDKFLPPVAKIYPGSNLDNQIYRTSEQTNIDRMTERHIDPRQYSVTKQQNCLNCPNYKDCPNCRNFLNCSNCSQCQNCSNWTS